MISNDFERTFPEYIAKYRWTRGFSAPAELLVFCSATDVDGHEPTDIVDIPRCTGIDFEFNSVTMNTKKQNRIRYDWRCLFVNSVGCGLDGHAEAASIIIIIITTSHT